MVKKSLTKGRIACRDVIED